jgi:hypothetical protein
MTFAAGFLTDYRFVNVGCGFGDEGLGYSLNSLEYKDVGGARLRREIQDRSLCLRRKFERVEVFAYLATDIDTNRWWRLPAIRFFASTGEQIYRPPILPEHHTKEWVSQCVRVIERLLRACDGTVSVEQVVRSTRDSFGSEYGSEIQQLCNIVLADLSVLGLLAAE